MGLGLVGFVLCGMYLLLYALSYAFPLEDVKAVHLFHHLNGQRFAFILQNPDAGCMAVVRHEVIETRLCTGRKEQLWELTNDFHLINVQEDKCLCMKEETLQLCACDVESELQKWTLFSDNRIAAVTTGQCLTVPKQKIPFQSPQSPRAPKKPVHSPQKPFAKDRRIKVKICENHLLERQMWSLGQVPDEWLEKVNKGDMLYADREPINPQMMASIGNGNLATTVGSDTIYVSGLFNGLDSRDPSHRARIPSPIAISLPGSTPFASALDIAEGVFYRRSFIDSSESGYIEFEQSWYANRGQPSSVIVHELKILTNQLTQTLRVDLTVGRGSNSQDIGFISEPLSPEVESYCGQTYVAEEEGAAGVRPLVCTCNSYVPVYWSVSPRFHRDLGFCLFCTHFLGFDPTGK